MILMNHPRGDVFGRRFQDRKLIEYPERLLSCQTFQCRFKSQPGRGCEMSQAFLSREGFELCPILLLVI